MRISNNLFDAAIFDELQSYDLVHGMRVAKFPVIRHAMENSVSVDFVLVGG